MSNLLKLHPEFRVVLPEGASGGTGKLEYQGVYKVAAMLAGASTRIKVIIPDPATPRLGKIVNVTNNGDVLVLGALMGDPLPPYVTLTIYPTLASGKPDPITLDGRPHEHPAGSGFWDLHDIGEDPNGPVVTSREQQINLLSATAAANEAAGKVTAEVTRWNAEQQGVQSWKADLEADIAQDRLRTEIAIDAALSAGDRGIVASEADLVGQPANADGSPRLYELTSTQEKLLWTGTQIVPGSRGPIGVKAAQIGLTRADLLAGLAPVGAAAVLADGQPYAADPGPADGVQVVADATNRCWRALNITQKGEINGLENGLRRDYSPSNTNSGTDTLARLNALLTAAAQLGRDFVLPAGNYRVNGSPLINGTNNILVNMAGATLWSSDTQSPVLRVGDTDGATLWLPRVNHIGVPPPTGNTNAGVRTIGGHGYTFDNVNYCTIYGIKTGSVRNGGARVGAVTGIGAEFVQSSGNIIVAPNVADTNADGIHFTRASSHNTVMGGRTYNTADDSFAVVAYTRDPGDCVGNKFVGCVSRKSYARAFTHVGAIDTEFDACTAISNSYGSFKSFEDVGFQSRAPGRVTFRGCRSVDAGKLQPAEGWTDIPYIRAGFHADNKTSFVVMENCEAQGSARQDFLIYAQGRFDGLTSENSGAENSLIGQLQCPIGDLRVRGGKGTGWYLAVNDCLIDGVFSVNAAVNGVTVKGDDNLITGLKIRAASQAANDSGSNYVIIGNRNMTVGGQARAGDQANKPTFGVKVFPGSDGNVFQGFDLRDSGGYKPYDDGGTNTQFIDCPGVAPAGPLPGTPAVPASGAALTNPYPFAVRVTVWGGAVTQVTAGGVAAGLTGGQFVLLPGESITLTYTAAPSWAWTAMSR